MNKLTSPSGMIKPVDNPDKYKYILDALKIQLAEMKPKDPITASKSSPPDPKSPSWLEIVKSDNIIKLRKDMATIYNRVYTAKAKTDTPDQKYMLPNKNITELSGLLTEIKTSLDILYKITFEIILPIKRLARKKITREELLEQIKTRLIETKHMDTIEPTNQKLLEDMQKAYKLLSQI